jgi:ketopantoate hydroxymethyltransferase
MTTPEENNDDKPSSSEIDWTSDSVRLLGNGERTKCMVIMDVTVMNEMEKHEFMNRALQALTALGADIMKIEPGEKSRIILPN